MPTMTQPERDAALYALMVAIYRNPGSTASELREIIGNDVLRTSTLYKRLTELHELGFADRSIDDHAFVYQLTDIGVTHMDSIKPVNDRDDDLPHRTTAAITGPLISSVFDLGFAAQSAHDESASQSTCTESQTGEVLDATHTPAPGLGWVHAKATPEAFDMPRVTYSADPNFKCGLLDDGSLLLKIDGKEVELSIKRTYRLITFLDLVRRTGQFAAEAA